ncbi:MULTISPECIES: hypothetical protein [Rufibacter]|uniref:Uncharacterized protein n=1 Tax=Rufibacter quisquiliarum TaxID=1549639 RepID=A0A839GPF7_9BACT|nr:MULTISPECIES: hypothetical protein [Rufibacter]MBA9075731.1 hypothetical protein [Rufibacter quisquiliarum]
MAEHTRYLITTSQGQEFDLTLAKELRSNNLYPFGLHNYAIYRSPEGVYIKGTNSGNLHLMLDTYEVIQEPEAQSYRHPHHRLED